MDLLLNSIKGWAGAPTARKVIEEEATEISFFKFHLDDLVLAAVEFKKTKQTKMKWKLIKHYCPRKIHLK